jgi:hypothetical protein
VGHGAGNEEWFALDVGCAVVYSRTDFSSSISEQRLISIAAGEPDAALFSVPSSFREVAPSEFSAVVRERFSYPCDSGCLQSESVGDESYRLARAAGKN